MSTPFTSCHCAHNHCPKKIAIRANSNKSTLQKIYCHRHISQHKLKTENPETCYICFDDYKTEDFITLTCTFHKFCINCIEQLCSPVCPLCRQKLTPSGKLTSELIDNMIAKNIQHKQEIDEESTNALIRELEARNHNFFNVSSARQDFEMLINHLEENPDTAQFLLATLFGDDIINSD